MNHKRPRETSWTYDDTRSAFTITALRGLGQGQQIYDSYGRKCNRSVTTKGRHSDTHSLA